MTLRKFGQISLAIALSLSSSLLINACGATQTIDFVYVTSSKSTPNGQISVYKADQKTGALIPLSSSPFDSGGANPVAEVASPNHDNLYVVNRNDNSVVPFSIQGDGTLTKLTVVNTPGLFPVGVAISPAGNFLYVTDTYMPGFSDENPGPGALVVYPIKSDGSLDSPVMNGTVPYFPVGYTPVGVNALESGTAVYVVCKGGGSNGDLGRVYAFTTGTSGALAPIGAGYYTAGVAPTAIASDPTNRFVYVTDTAANQLIGYLVTNGNVLTPMPNGPFKTDRFPVSVAVDPRGYYVYVSNYNSATISSYAIDLSNGSPSQVAGSGSSKTGTNPGCIIVEPALGRFVYTANFADDTVTAMQLNPHTGVLSGVQNSPFSAGGQPTCVAAIPHGNHAIQNVSP
jgi:6-phosphogluconolactonase